MADAIKRLFVSKAFAKHPPRSSSHHESLSGRDVVLHLLLRLSGRQFNWVFSVSHLQVHTRDIQIRPPLVSGACGVAKTSCFYRLLTGGRRVSSSTFLSQITNHPATMTVTRWTRLPTAARPTIRNPLARWSPVTILCPNATSTRSLSTTSPGLSLQIIPSIDFSVIADLSLASLGRRDTASLKSNQLLSISPLILHLHVTSHRLAPPLDKSPIQSNLFSSNLPLL